MAVANLTLTILDLPEVIEFVRVLLEHVPEWEHPVMVEEWNAILARARAKRGD